MNREEQREIFMNAQGGGWNDLYPHLGDYIADAFTDAFTGSYNDIFHFDIKTHNSDVVDIPDLFNFNTVNRLGYLGGVEWWALHEAVQDKNFIAIGLILSSCPKYQEKYGEFEPAETFLL